MASEAMHAGPERGPDAEPDAAGGTADPRVSAGMEHLQRAALEMIAAARAFLDVVEDLVTDEEKAAEVVGAVTAATRAAARAATGTAAAQGDPAGSADGGLERIDVR